jgi:WD40 repeat protein
MLRVWDARTGAAVRELAGHRDGVFGMEFSPDGSRLATASYDRTVRVWNLATGESRVLSGHVGPVWGVTWLGPDRLATVSGDGTVRMWLVPAVPVPDLDQLRRRLDTLTAVAMDREPHAAADPSLGTDARPALALSPDA